MKKNKILFWSTTIIIVLFEGVMPLLTFQTEPAKEGIKHLGYPEYFLPMLLGFKILGIITLIIPRVPNRIKEWAYAGFAIDFISACVSHWVVDGFGFKPIFPLIFLVILAISYINYNKINSNIT